MQPPQLSLISTVVDRLIQTSLAAGALLLFIMLLIGGLKYLTSGGDPKATEGAKKTLTYAIGGIFLLAGAFIILRIVGEITGTGLQISTFTIFR